MRGRPLVGEGSHFWDYDLMDETQDPSLTEYCLSA